MCSTRDLKSTDNWAKRNLPRAHSMKVAKFRKSVSRLGIEPRTRRLRVQGGKSAGVQVRRLPQQFGEFLSTVVQLFCRRPAVRVSVRVSALERRVRPSETTFNNGDGYVTTLSASIRVPQRPRLLTCGRVLGFTFLVRIQYALDMSGERSHVRAARQFHELLRAGRFVESQVLADFAQHLQHQRHLLSL